MIRLLIIIITMVLFFWFLISLLALVFSRNKHSDKKTISVKKSSIDYWYTHPHYYVCDDGTKINIPEYFTYEEWNNMSNVKKYAYMNEICGRLKKFKDYNPETDENYEEVIK